MFTAAQPDSTPSATHQIVTALTQAIVTHQLPPGTKLVEQKIASQFGVSRTLVRQALFQLSQHGLIRMEPARGAFVATPSADEARQVFAVRRMLEAEMVRAFVRQVSLAQIRTLKTHVKSEKAALGRNDPSARAERTQLLRDFHVHMAELMGNQVLAELLAALISRCSLITLMYQSARAAEHSSDEHVQIIDALAAKDEALAIRLMDEHLQHVQAGLDFASQAP
jgi:DNA-binding GntR family transcriptional regulator